jgi:hypothetical protein
MGACNTGFGNCNMTPADGCEVNLTSDNAHCGSCGTSCARLTGSTNYPHACRASVCRPGNDACTNATPINLAAGRRQWFEALTAGATADLAPPCQSSAGPDVFFSFTLTQRELVYADTMGDATHPGPAWDTILYLANGCTTAMTGAPTGQRYCSDDARSEGCAQDGDRSQVYAVLNPGTYYLVVSGFAGATGRSWVHFEHMPVGNGNAVALTVTPGMSQTHRGTTAGTGQIATPTCGGAGPEVSYWWRTCTDGRRHMLSATTCDMFTNFDTVLWLRNGDAAAAPDVCNDDNGRCGVRRNSSEVSGVVHAGTGLHVVTVDGFNAGSAGNYQLVLTP